MKKEGKLFLCISPTWSKKEIYFSELLRCHISKHLAKVFQLARTRKFVTKVRPRRKIVVHRWTASTERWNVHRQQIENKQSDFKVVQSHFFATQIMSRIKQVDYHLSIFRALACYQFPSMHSVSENNKLYFMSETCFMREKLRNFLCQSSLSLFLVHSSLSWFSQHYSRLP